jgi:hypothetical protein
MSFAALVDRVRGDFMDLPGLELTLSQAVRLWNIGPDDCRSVMDALVDGGFLRWTARRTVVRSGRALTGREAAWIDPSHITVVTSSKRNNFVARG